MAFIQTSGNRKSIHVDLTPMVDLGFLLISFFMLTTSMSRPKAMELQMPYKPSNDPTEFYESSAITLIPAKDHKVYYYEGLPVGDPKLLCTSFATKGLRSILADKQKRIANRPDLKQREVQAIIRPADDATLDDLVQILDEMKILDIRCYAVTDISAEEILSLKKYE